MKKKLLFLFILIFSYALNVVAQEKPNHKVHDHSEHHHSEHELDQTKSADTKRTKTLPKKNISTGEQSCGKIDIEVNGLVCDFCARSLEKVFRKKKLAQNIDVDLEDGLVKINLNKGKSLNDTELTKLITDSGYNVVKIKRLCKT